MSTTIREGDTPHRGHEPAVELSAEEQQVLARIEKQAKPRRRKPWWRRVADGSTLFYWWWFY